MFSKDRTKRSSKSPCLINWNLCLPISVGFMSIGATPEDRLWAREGAYVGKLRCGPIGFSKCLPGKRFETAKKFPFFVAAQKNPTKACLVDSLTLLFEWEILHGRLIFL